MRTKFSSIYLACFFFDAAAGVVLSLLGFLSPAHYQTWLLSPASAAESLAFWALTVVFAIHVFWAGLPKVFFVLPAYVAAGVALTFQSSRNVYRALAHRAPPPDDLQELALRIETVKDPEYLTVALVASVLGLIVGGWILALSRAERPRRR